MRFLCTRELYCAFLRVTSQRYSALSLSDVSPIQLSHDSISRWLEETKYQPKNIWNEAKKMVNKLRKHFDRRSSQYELTDWVTDSILENKIIKIIGEITPKTLLDLGIGTGLVEQKISKEIDISGIDISQGMLEICQSRLPKATLICGNFADLDKHFRKNSFDVIFARVALGHLKISPVLKKTKQLLSSRGKIILCESISYDKKDSAIQVDFHNLIHPGHVEFPTVEQFIEKFSDLKMSTKYEIVFTTNNTESLFNSINASNTKRIQIEAFLLKLSERKNDPWLVRRSGFSITYRRPWILSISEPNEEI